MGRKMPKVCFLFAKKNAGLKRTPLPVVAVVTLMTYNVNNVDVFFVMIRGIKWTRWKHFLGDKHSFNSSPMSKRRGHKKTQVITLHSLRLCAWSSASNGSAYDEVTLASEEDHYHITTDFSISQFQKIFEMNVRDGLLYQCSGTIAMLGEGMVDPRN